MFFTKKWKQWKRRARLFADHPSERRRSSQRPLLFLEPLEDRLVLSNGLLAPVTDPSVAAQNSSPPSPPPALPSNSSPSGATPALSGAWTNVTAFPTGSPGTMLLLPNGDVMVQGANDNVVNTWYELQPNASGSYANGTWTQLASMSHGRLFFGSVVLGSDRVFVLGGEYSTLSSFDNTGEIYNIASNTWSSIPNFPQNNFGDDPTDVLPNGDILAGYLIGPQTYLYNPSTNTWSNGPTKLDSDRSDEETWIKLPASAALPQGGILSYSIFASTSTNTFKAQVYNIATNTWSETKNSTTNPPSLLSNTTLGFELGGGLLLPNGKVFLIGANGNTALYDPSTNTWSAGPQILDKNGNLLGADDAPASILPDGQVLFSADYGPTTGIFSPPTELFDYDYNTNTITQITNLPNTLASDLSNNPAFIDRTLVLPSGQLLFNDGVNLFLFTPSDSPQNAWRPTITNIVKNGANSYTLTGTQLSGISEGSSYGDDVNVSENYPIVQITDSNGNVHYATTSNWSNVGVSVVGDTTAETVNFTLPAGLPNGVYQLTVIANGIASVPHNFVIGIPVTTTVTPQNTSTPFSPNQQTVPLTADVNVVGGGQTVNEGQVTFTVLDQNGKTIGTPVSGAVNSNGVATANYILPASVPVGAYTVAAHYTDSLNKFVDSSDTNGTLTISPAKVITTAVSPTFSYSPNAQTVMLNATLADTSIAADTVSEGAVTFTVLNGSTEIGTIQGKVTNGTASASFTLPAGLAHGSYTLTVSYKDSAGNFIDNGDNAGTLTIAPANVATTAAGLTTAYSPNSQTVTLNATLADTSIPNDIVNEGSVTFTIKQGGTIIGVVPGVPVSDDRASAKFNLPAGQTQGTYTIDVGYADISGNFTDNGDNSGTLNVTPANVATTANNASAFYSPKSQIVNLSASVADFSIPADTVGEGTVKFTIESGGTTIGTAQGTVTAGAASASFKLAPGQAAGSYTIAVSYSDSPNNNFIDDGDSSATLTIAPAQVTTTALTPVSITFSPTTQTVALNATVADTSIPTDTVNEGVVTFTVKDSNQAIIGNAYGTVSGDAASATFTWSAGRAAGSYTIDVSYSDSAGNFYDTGDTPATLTVNPAQVTTTANSPLPVIFSSNTQTVMLSAAVTDTSIPGGTVNEGTVVFTVKNGATVVGSPVQGAVISGVATANFTLPAGQAAGSYTIAVNYSDSPNNNFIDNSDTPATLTIIPAQVTTAANNASAVYSPNTQTVALHASVANVSVPSNTVGEGTVTFTVLKGSTVIGTPVQAPVSNGTANAMFHLPAGQAAGSYTIAVTYSDSPNNNFIDNGDSSAILTIAPAQVTTTANIASTAFSPNAQTLTLSAAVADTSIPTDTVNEGTVTFTVLSGSTKIGQPIQGTVSGGIARANFSLPAGQALGSYTVAVSYSDSPNNNFTDNSDQNSTLTIAPANVVITANNVSTFYSPNTQTLTLNATVTDTSIPTDTVNEGTVTFTITDGLSVLGTVSNMVSGGAASASFTLPAGLAHGSYTIAVSYSDPSGHFVAASDPNGTLTIAPANVVITANNVSTFYSPNTQTLTLNATVKDTSIPSDTVNEGVVTFTVLNGSTPLGSTTGLVNGGAASATFTWPAGQAAGSYTIAVNYSDSAGNFTDISNITGTLTATVAHVTTTAGNVSAVYSPNTQTVALSASLADTSVPTDTVNEGTVTFTVLNGSTPLGTPVQAPVSNGTANVNFSLPAGQTAGNYTIIVSYSDTQGHFIDSGDISGILAVAPNNVTTTAASTSTTFSSASQTVTLSATVANMSNGGTAVNEGHVTFTILNSSTIVGSSQDPVNGGAASVHFTLPAGLAAGTYTLAVSYSDSQGNFTDVGDAYGTLTVNAAPTTVQLIQATLTPNYTNLTATETLTAHVSSSSTVNRGTVAFSLSNQTVLANVDGNGNATAILVMPMLDLLAPQSINTSYNDPANNFTASSNSQTAPWQSFNPLLPSTATFTPAGLAVTVDINGFLVTFTNGVITEIDFGSMHVVLTYNAGQLVQVTVDGINLLP